MGDDKATLAATEGATRRTWGLFALGLILIAVGVLLAAMIQTAGGVRVSDIRFRGADGTTFSALLYQPRNATAATPAPGVLAVHGYINTRETQSAFAIEFARRGYVVLALDQRGHGYSGGAAVTNGFGGPEGLAYLRSLPFVDKDQIGLEGHSMGGWTVLAAAAAMPEAYRALVLAGSSAGPPFSKPADLAWPRNMAVVFSRYDEFAKLMWGVDRAAEVGQSPRLQAAFGSAGPVEAGRLYGDAAAGTGRVLHSPPVTHPGDHISTAAVGHATDWFARTLAGGTPRPASDQIWMWKELGTGLAFLGVVVLLLGVFDLLLATRPFAALRGSPAPVREARGGRWWTLLLLTAFVPAVTFFLLPINSPPLKPSALFPQAITNSLVIWALGNTVLALLIGWALGRPGPSFQTRWAPAALIALASVAVAYLTVWAASLVQVDFRFWVVALKPLSADQALAALAYLPAFAAFLLVAFRGVAGLMVRNQGRASQYLTAVVALASGFLLLTGLQYVVLFATGALPVPALALSVIVAIQFVPLLTALAIIAVFTWRRTNSYVPGALLSALFVTWYMVAGTATHVSG